MAEVVPRSLPTVPQSSSRTATNFLADAVANGVCSALSNRDDKHEALIVELKTQLHDLDRRLHQALGEQRELLLRVLSGIGDKQQCASSANKHESALSSTPLELVSTRSDHARPGMDHCLLPSSPPEARIALPVSEEIPSVGKESPLFEENSILRSEAHPTGFASLKSATKFIGFLKAECKLPEWKKLTPSCTQKLTWRRYLCDTARFYWIGLTSSSQHKNKHMKLLAKLAIVDERAEVFIASLSNRVREEMIQKAAQKIGLQGAVALDASDARLQEAIDVAIAENCLSRLEATLLNEKTLHLLDIAGCPIRDFLHMYLEDRDDALAQEDLRKRNFELAKAISRGTEGVRALCDALKARIDYCDSLVFKIVVLAMNFSIALGQFVYDTRINPDQVCNCEAA